MIPEARKVFHHNAVHPSYTYKGLLSEINKEVFGESRYMIRHLSRSDSTSAEEVSTVYSRVVILARVP